MPAHASEAKNGDNTQRVSPKMKTRNANVATRRASGESMLIGMRQAYRLSAFACNARRAAKNTSVAAKY